LSVGALVPRKGFDVLIAALATLTDLPWRLTLAGDRTRDPQVAAQLDADIAHHALGDRIVLAGEVSAQHLEKLHVDADVFTLASRFEGYGMAYAEAIAHGLPVIGTSAGAIPDTVPRGAGILVAPDNPAAFAQALRRIIEDPNERLRLRTAARAAAGSLPDLASLRADFSRAVEAVNERIFCAWLALREPYDTRARNADVFSAVAALFKQRDLLRIVDLACGTGSAVRALGPRLAARQNWRLADNDPGLLADVANMPTPKDVTVSAVALDLTRDLEAALEGPVDLVSASALLDLVSKPWLERLAVETVARSISVYATLSYDGRIELAPLDPLDASIVPQSTHTSAPTKASGPLGPAAAAAAIRTLQSIGYSVVQGASDWTIGPDDHAMRWKFLPAGQVPRTKRETDQGRHSHLADSPPRRGHRRTFIDRVGHVDFFATRCTRAEPKDRNRIILRRRSDARASARARLIGPLDFRQDEACAA
jgi:hypothetical protein